MPTKKRAFIERSRARTYEVVYRPLADRRDGPDRVLRALPRCNASDPSAPDAGDAGDSFAYEAPVKKASSQEGAGGVGSIDAAAWEEEYAQKRATFELGEYGLPDDGYDYSKHFKIIGGSGAVFVAKSGETSADGATEIVAGGDEFRGREDMRRKETVLEKLSQERQDDPELDEVLAALESSDDETRSGEKHRHEESEEEEAVEPGANPARQHVLDDASGESDLDLEDEFVALARRVPGENQDAVLAVEETLAVQEVATRKKRLLDDKFDQLMSCYDEESGSDNDGDGVVEGICNDTSIVASGDDDYDGDADDCGTSCEGISLNREMDADMLAELAADLPNNVSRADNDIDRAMEALVGEYKRATVEETYFGPNSVRAPEAIAGVRKAAAQHFERGPETSPTDLRSLDSRGNTIASLEGFNGDEDCRERDEAIHKSVSAADSDDGYDVVQGRVAERWDCETVLSTYSNLDNHPSIIGEDTGHRRKRTQRKEAIIRLDPRTSAPIDYMPASRRNLLSNDTDHQGISDEDDLFPRTNVAAAHVPVRDKNEGKEAKRLRKERAKVAARARRQEKKDSKLAFASEFKKQDNHGTKMGKSKVLVHF